MTSLPLATTVFLISIPSAAKNPFLTPRSSGNVFAIGSVSSFTSVVGVARGALAADPP
jgi:hypothetical protein